MEDLSESAIKADCPHCHEKSQAFKYPLGETKNFHIVCDAHPLTTPHILIIPKKHLASIADYDDKLLDEFKRVYEKVGHGFIAMNYGSVATFEHGVYGQTVFHSHIHLLPFTGTATDIVPEGKDRLRHLSDFKELRKLVKDEGGYLFFSIDDKMWTVDPALAKPRFFRDRFAQALGRPERANWKEVHVNSKLMAGIDKENTLIQKEWKQALM